MIPITNLYEAIILAAATIFAIIFLIAIEVGNFIKKRNPEIENKIQYDDDIFS